MTTTATPVTFVTVTVGRAGRAIHMATAVPAADGTPVADYTVCGSEGRTPGASRLYAAAGATVTCKRCAATDIEPTAAAEPVAEPVAEPAAEPAAVVPTVRTRPVGLDLLEVYTEQGDTRTAVGRIMARGIDARWDAYNIIGTRVAASVTRDAALAAVMAADAAADERRAPADSMARSRVIAERIRGERIATNRANTVMVEQARRFATSLIAATTTLRLTGHDMGVNSLRSRWGAYAIELGYDTRADNGADGADGFALAAARFLASTYTTRG